MASNSERDPPWGATFALSAWLATVAACTRGEGIELVALRGCGLDQEFSGLRVRVLGDVPVSGGSELLLGPGEVGQIESLPSTASGVAAEGLFGTTVTAIGRSWGVDPELHAGRISGVESQALALWFAAPDSLCTLEVEFSPSEDAGIGLGPHADVLWVGGADTQGTLSDRIGRLDLFTDDDAQLEARLPTPLRKPEVWSRGQRSFVVFGGGGAGELSAQMLGLDLDNPAALEDLGELERDGQSWMRAEFASALDPARARIVLAGGCDAVDEDGRCVPGSARVESGWFDPGSLATEALPDLNIARQAGLAVVSVDGVVFVAGGVGAQGQGLGSVERLRPGDAVWELLEPLPDQREIRGLAVLEGGLLLLSDELGTIHWSSEAGAGVLDPSARAPALSPADGLRPMLVLPGERVLIDNWLFSPATAAIDPALERQALTSGSRSDAWMGSLADGSVLLAGGFDPQTGSRIDPPVQRLRPRLDGPDEWIPELTGPQTDAFVSNAPGLARISVGGLRLEGVEEQGSAISRVRAHVRGFRSGNFRLEFDYEVDAGASARVVFGHGAEALVAIELDTEAPVVRQRRPDGSVEQLTCAQGPGALDTPLVVELTEQGRELTLAGASGEVLACTLDWPTATAVSVGFGVRGAAAARFFGLRLARR